MLNAGGRVTSEKLSPATKHERRYELSNMSDRPLAFKHMLAAGILLSFDVRPQRVLNGNDLSECKDVIGLRVGF